MHSPLKEKRDAPRQAVYGKDINATVEIFSEYEAGLKGIEKFSNIILLCHFHKSNPGNLRVIPPDSCRERGIFASRSPAHPNSIGLSVVKLKKVNGRILHIRNVDILDNTPVLDIKPYIEKLNI